MAYNETRITLTGIVASQVTCTTVGTGDVRAKFRLLSTERRFDPERQAWVSGAHMFLSVTCWRSLAENVHLSLSKNDPVVVHGKMTIKELPDGDSTRQFVDIDAHAVGPNLATCTAAVTRVRRDGDAPATAPRGEPRVQVGGEPPGLSAKPTARAPAGADGAAGAGTGGAAGGGSDVAPDGAGDAVASGPPTRRRRSGVVAPRKEGEVTTLFGGVGESAVGEGEEVVKIPF
ncbi:single-stranded DNA-binding protein [Saccharothrix australiensis]|uniref:Single-strand DNA-binding protein n=1 Tax=Saccharothrix australiensis TaxID=2072 RepID=A0A495VUL8_9PSEU|nr:single-stranded DNA-binding protein [Saccharothrix australiensis]RKT53032.1 single-strand DNA-binding protein [Saccharothrix australiensis]